MSGRGRQGRFGGLPYDLRRPTRDKLVAGLWQPDNPRLFVPKVYGWGYGLNRARLFGRRPHG